MCRLLTGICRVFLRGWLNCAMRTLISASCRVRSSIVLEFVALGRLGAVVGGRLKALAEAGTMGCVGTTCGGMLAAGCCMNCWAQSVVLAGSAVTCGKY